MGDNQSNQYPTCEWSKESTFWYTSSCNKEEGFNSLELTRFKYCPYCGKKIKLKETLCQRK
jgi:ribosomal protein L33